MAKHYASVHDNFIRAILSDKNIAKDYFQNFLPAFVSNRLDLTSLTQLPDTYLSGSLQKTVSDIVYSCMQKAGERVVRVCLLIEHKSYLEKHTPIQIGSYIFSGYAKQIANKEELSIIIPILLYHGKEKWEYKKLSGLFPNLEDDWKKFIPDFEYVYNNLGDISDKNVESLENKFLAASILSLKHTFQKDWLESNFRHILVLSEDASKNLQMNLLVYLFRNADINESKLTEIFESLQSTLKDTPMTIAEMFEKKGLVKGLERGTEITKTNFVTNLLKNTDFTVTRIAMLSEVSEDLVIKIKRNLNSEKI